MRRWFSRRKSNGGSAPALLSDAGTLPEWAHDDVPKLAVDGSAATVVALLGWLRSWPSAPREDAAFLAWAAAPSTGESAVLSRFLLALWRSRPDLRDAFPGVPIDVVSQHGFLEWSTERLVHELPDLPPSLIPQRQVAAPPTEPARRSPGLLVVGYLRAILGLGDAGRRLVHLLEQADESVRSVSFDYVEAPIRVPWNTRDDDGPIDPEIVFLAVNATEAPMIRSALPSRELDGRHTIGLWFWELEDLSPAMAAGFDAVDEVWVTSEFTANAVRAAAPPGFPVHVLPLGADLRSAALRTPRTRSRFGLPADAVVVGNVFDFASRIERKNPVGLIAAWKLAFPVAAPDERVLFFKTLNAENEPDSATVVAAACDGRTDIIVRDERLSAEDRDLLVPQFDVVAALHRAEGYGLTLLEAMHHGIPVIASGYSGNLAFMTAENSWLVPCTPALVDADSLVSYPKGGRWGEPDVVAAAAMLREVVGHITSDEVRQRAERGRHEVRALIDGTAGAEWIANRLAEIRRERSSQR